MWSLGKHFIVSSHLVFLFAAAQELFQEGSTSTRHLFQSSSPNPLQFSSATSVSVVFSVSICLLLFSLTDGHWLLRPVMDTGTQGDKGPLTFSRWLGLCLICAVSPSLAKHKSPELHGAPLHPLTPTMTPINQITFCF